MTTAAEFRAVATNLASGRDRLAKLMRPVGAEPVPLTGPLAATVTTAIDVVHANIRTALAELAVQIEEAHRRALVCDAYTEAVRRFLRSDDPDRRWPAPSARWVTHG